MSGGETTRGERATWRLIGPGLVVAATGVGAGDLIAAAKAGALHGTDVLWAVALGSVFKYVLTEGLARYQLARGRPLLAAWMRDMGPWIRGYFLVYLLLWSFIVGAAMMTACGLAARALFGGLEVAEWGALHGLLGLALVWFGGYAAFERGMKLAIGGMFVAICGTALWSRPDASEVLRGLFVPSVPEGSLLLLLGVIGGVGGTLTLLSYSYWIQEKGWHGPAFLRAVRLDLAVGYGFTGVFGVALILLAAEHLLPRGVQVSGSGAALQLAGILGEELGRAGEVLFLVGFWAAVATSLVGVWQGVPYLFAHATALSRGAEDTAAVDTRGRAYRGFALFLTLPPLVLLFYSDERPVWLVVSYAAFGALFMPFLAGTLLWVGRRRELGGLANGRLTTLVLWLCLLLFLWVGGANVYGRL